MAEDRFQLAGNAASVYEQQKVPAIFRPLADATLDAVSLRPDDTILDVACGTGIVARRARQRLGPAPRIVGVDLNEGMIATARSLTEEAARSCEWHVADVTRLPFDDATFSIALCQQGIQFFPDEEAALREIRRVLQPGGRLALTVWSGASDLFVALADALTRHVDATVGARSLAPFSYGGIDALKDRIADLGFRGITAELIAVDRHIPDPETAIPREILANPVGPAVEARGPEVMRRVVADTIAELAAYRRAEGFVIPQHAHLIQVRLA